MEAKSSALLERCINDLKLRYTPSACETHVLRVVVSRDEMWPSSTSTPGELFTVTKFQVMDVQYARESMVLWKDCMRELEIQRREAKANGLGMIAVVGIECPALATVRLLQFTGVGRYLLVTPAESGQRSHRRARR